MTRFSQSLLLGLVASAAFAACTSDIEDETTPVDPNNTTGTTDNTFDHENDGRSPFEVIADQAIAGPARYQARVHSCSTMLYQNLRNVLTSRGINAGSTAANTAGALYNGGSGSLGAANFASRSRSNRNATTAGMVKQFDIWGAGATEIITAFANNTVAACRAGGAAPTLFDGGSQCNRAAFTCLLGAPVTDAHIDLCNKTISGARNPTTNAPDQALGQRLAVAVMLSAGHICE